jgi:hypothetical protein
LIEAAMRRHLTSMICFERVGWAEGPFSIWQPNISVSMGWILPENRKEVLPRNGLYSTYAIIFHGF